MSPVQIGVLRKQRVTHRSHDGAFGNGVSEQILPELLGMARINLAFY